jgi:hypothetical protein
MGDGDTTERRNRGQKEAEGRNRRRGQKSDKEQLRPDRKQRDKKKELRQRKEKHRGTEKQTGRVMKRQVGGEKDKKRRNLVETVGVMFVEQMKGGALAKRLQQVEDRLGGQEFRIVENAGNQLRRVLPNTNPWAGVKCGREDCHPCNQGGEKLPDCFRRNVLYESRCTGPSFEKSL